MSIITPSGASGYKAARVPDPGAPPKIIKFLNMSQKTALIIGGGLAGLSTAALLAKDGWQVTLLEKNHELGGRARVLKAKGFTFDMGPSWYLMPEIADQLFNQLGFKTSDFFKLKPLSPKYKVFRSDKPPIVLTDDLNENLSQFAKIDANSTKNINKLIEKTSQIYDLAVNKFLHEPYHHIFDFINFTDVKNILTLLSLFNPFESYHRLVSKYIKNPDLQKIFEFHTVFLGGDPFHTPALYSMLIAADFKQKVWYPQGGIGQLVDALVKICQKLKVKVVTNAPVTELIIDHQSQKITAVKSDTKIFKADLIINTMDYATFDQTLLPQKYREYKKSYWQQRNYSISSVLVYLGINKKVPGLAHHNFYFQNDWRQHFDTIQNTPNLPENPCFYLSAPSISDQSVAPKGKENLFLLIPTGVQTQEKDLASYVDRVLTHVEQVTRTKFKNAIGFQKIYGRSDFARDYNAYLGNALGLSHTLMQSVFLRPRMQAKHLKNLFYAGQFTQPGVGVPMVMLSAMYLKNMIGKITK